MADTITPLREATQELVFRLKLPRQLIVNERAATRKALEQALERGYRVVELDASEMEYIDSAGLNVLITAANAFSAQRGLLAISELNPQLAELFKLTEAETVLFIRREQYLHSADRPAEMRELTAEDLAALRTVVSMAKVGLKHRQNEDTPIFERAIADVEQLAQEIEDALP